MGTKDELGTGTSRGGQAMVQRLLGLTSGDWKELRRGIQESKGDAKGSWLIIAHDSGPVSYCLHQKL